MMLKLKKETWENIFLTVRNQPQKTTFGNFWVGIQNLETQFKKHENIDELTVVITQELYNAYGSETGVLFGIPSNLKSSVKSIVKLILQRGN